MIDQKQYEKVKCQVYNAFYLEHIELYQENNIEYHRQSNKFVENKMRLWRYYSKDPFSDTKKSDGLWKRILKNQPVKA